METVIAVGEISEYGFRRRGARHVHARAGDVGQVLHVDGEWLTVTWPRGTTDVHESEVKRTAAAESIARAP